ncbi:MAG: SulP family inorganic anion transporter [Oscillospiraceae bacterium]|nr:SulP family inorganic anion transporter [Oscillospiraceae bacterium]
MKHWKADILSGVIVALVSIPISMGYAQIAGLPPVYGLYGSVLPILVFALLTSSPQFVVGVDAMPAVMTGAAISAMGFTLGTQDAMDMAAILALLTGVWFLVFWVVKAGRVVKYISSPVMGGFISGVGATIILMQVPKLFGGAPGTGELPELAVHIALQLGAFHPLSCVLGVGTVALMLVAKRFAPRFPMAAVLLALGVVLTAALHVDRYGVALLPEVRGGLPGLRLPPFELLAGRLETALVPSLTIALVVMAQTLLASNNYALRYRYRIDTRRELLAYAGAELAAGLVGCCPVNGSVSRSGMADQFGVKSQLMSLTASLVMVLVLLFGTPLLRFLPVPVLTGIVVAALIGILEFKMARSLWKTNRREFFIFLAAFFGVLLLGTMGGVVVGVLLSFFAVVVRAVVPPRAMLGTITGHEGFYDLKRTRGACPIAGTVLYRFSGNLFFANIGDFEADIEGAVTDETRQVIVDGRGIANIDITAAERVVLLEERLRERGVRLYLTEHVGAVNDQLRQYGAGDLIRRGCVRRTVELALRDAGLEPPYPLHHCTLPTDETGTEQFAEFEWLFGADADRKLDEMAGSIAEEFAAVESATLADAEAHAGFSHPGVFDEDTLLDRIELHLEELAQAGELRRERLAALEQRLEQQRLQVEQRLRARDPLAASLLRSRRERLRDRLRQKSPELYARIKAHWDQNG